MEVVLGESVVPVWEGCVFLPLPPSQDERGQFQHAGPFK